MNRNLGFLFSLFVITTSCNIPIPDASETQVSSETMVEVTEPDVVTTLVPSSDSAEIPSGSTTEPSIDNMPPIDYENAIPKYAADSVIYISRIGMTDSATGWAVGQKSGDSDHIFKTEDGGETWWDITPPETAPLSAEIMRAETFFLDDSTAWVSYEPYTTVWRTTDGGIHWWPARVPMEGYLGATLWFLDADNGWMMKYLDGGMNHVYSALFHTSTGGRFWNKLLDPTSSGDLQSFPKTGMVFSSPDMGWITRDPQGVKPGAWVDATSDGGYTWDELNIPSPIGTPEKFEQEYCGMFNPELFSTSSGALVITCRRFDDGNEVTSSYLASTTDSGATWTLNDYPGGELQFITQDIAYALGREIHKSVDGGKSWVKIREVSWDGQFSFVDENLAWAVARAEEEIALVHTADGASKFSEIKPQVINPPAAYKLEPPNPSAGINPTDFGGGSKQLSFISCRENDDPHATDIYMINISGSDLKELTDSSGQITHFSWSLDGQRLVFDSDRNGVVDIFTMKADGTELTQITSKSFDEEDPAWSPDGTQIAYVSRGPGNDAIYLMNTDGSAAQHLVDGRRPAWSPDGSRIAFSRVEDGIFVIDVDGSNLTRLTDSTLHGYDDYPEWSPDGERILFSSNLHEPDVSGTESVYVMNTDGSEIMPLSDMWGAGPYTWSPDGQWIAYAYSFGCAAEVYVMDSQGFNVRALNLGGPANFHPLWRP